MWQSGKRSDGELCGPECSPCSVATWDSAHLSGLTCKMREPNGTAPESELLVASDRNLSWLSYHGRYSRDPNGVIRATHCLSLSQLRAFLHLLFGKFFAWGPWVTAGAGVQLSSPGGKRALQSPERLGKAQRTGLGCAWPSRGHGPPQPIPHAGVWGLARLGRALTPNLGWASALRGHMKEQRGGRLPKGKLGRCFQKTGMALRQAEVTRHHASILLARSSPRPEGPLASCVRSSPMGGSQNPARSSLICFTSVNSLTHAPFTEPLL